MPAPIDFPEMNCRLGSAMAERLEIKSLPVCTDGKLCVSCWQLSDEEQRQLIQNDGKLYLVVALGGTMPPVSMSVPPPFADAFPK